MRPAAVLGRPSPGGVGLRPDGHRADHDADIRVSSRFRTSGEFEYECLRPTEVAVVNDRAYSETKAVLGGFCIIEVATGDEEVSWAKKLAASCRCAQEIRELLFDPESDWQPMSDEWGHPGSEARSPARRVRQRIGTSVSDRQETDELSSQ